MLLVITPSRGRPTKAAELLLSFKSTAVDLDSRLIIVVDHDDPTWREYPNDLREPRVLSYMLDPGDRPAGMLPALNAALEIPEILDAADVVGFVGDDHRFRTPGWDAAIEDFLLMHPGIAYGDDLNRGASLPTNWFVSRQIVDVFGMGLPTLRHLYIDDYWKSLGSAAGCLYYLPDVKIEHMHPTVGKSDWDEGYRRVNDPGMYEADGAAFTAWRINRLEEDAVRLRSIVLP